VENIYKMKNKIIYLIIAIAVIGLVFWKITVNKDKANQEIIKETNIKKMSVETFLVKNHDFKSGFETTTSLESSDMSNVSSEISGMITFMNVKLGDRVSKGQTIASIDNEIASRQYQQSQINLEKVKNTYLKYKELDKSNNIPKIEVQNIEFEYLSLQKQVAIAKKAVNQSKIIAPISGIITLKNVSKGDVIQPFSPIISIASNNVLKATINLNFLDWSSLKINDKTTIVYEGNNTEILGTITKKIPFPTQSKTYPIEITVVNPKNLVPGLSVKVSLNSSKFVSQLAIPRTAIELKDNQSFCYTIANNQIKKVSVVTGIFDNDFIEVKSGLNANDEIISKGIQSISNTTKVENLIKIQK
jgi:membrane fusion protein, multidrug efflux system